MSTRDEYSQHVLDEKFLGYFPSSNLNPQFKYVNIFLKLLSKLCLPLNFLTHSQKFTPSPFPITTFRNKNENSVTEQRKMANSFVLQHVKKKNKQTKEKNTKLPP